jgi:hypothetical protein
MTSIFAGLNRNENLHLVGAAQAHPRLPDLDDARLPGSHYPHRRSLYDTEFSKTMDNGARPGYLRHDTAFTGRQELDWHHSARFQSPPAC